MDRAEIPLYLRIAERALHLRELGISDRAIARALGVTDKTVARAVHAAAFRVDAASVEERK